MSRRVLLTLVVVAVLLGITVWWTFRDDPYDAVTPGSRATDHLAITGEPLFPFGDLYLDGRSAWARRVLDADLKTFRTAPAPASTEVVIDVRDEAFTDGAWTDHLDDAARTRRDGAETKLLETRLSFVVPGITPRKLALYIACADIGAHLAPDGAIRHSVPFAAADDAAPPDSLPVAPGRFLSRRTTRGGRGELPTDAWYANALRRDGDVWVLRRELWLNVVGDGGATVRFDTSQVLVAPAPDGAARVSEHAWYRGQSFPKLLRGLAVSTARRHHRGWVAAVIRQAPKWEPGAGVAGWARAEGL